MSVYYPLDWQNENSLTAYPFNSSLFVNNFIIDAKFIQFDQYIPTLNSVVIDVDKIILSMTFDFGEINNLIYKKTNYLSGPTEKNLRIYTPDNSRYLGVLVFGEGLLELWNYSVGKKYQINSFFLSSTVIGIPKQAGVYSLDDLYGAINLSRQAQDSTIFYNTYISGSTESNAITFNAVAGHEITGDPGVLRKINLVSPVNNNINLFSNDVIKVYSTDNTTLNIGLAAGETSKSFIIPTLIA